MRKIIILAFLVFVLLVPWLAFAQETDCPYGLVNDPAPGSCSRYIDQDGNDVCDLSEQSLTKIALDKAVAEEELRDIITGQDLKAKKVYEVAELYKISQEDYANALAKYLGKKIKLTDTFRILHDNYGLEPSRAKDIATAIATGANPDIAAGMPAPATVNKNVARYKILLITVILIVLYLFTYILVLKKKITLLTHHRIWNVWLLLAFLPTLILGLLLIIRINRGWALDLPFNMLYWHVEFGTAMAIISIFHIAWHWRYYACMFKKRKS